MIEKSEWDILYRSLIAEGRKGLGEPPSADEVQALFDGELPDEEAARVRALLVYYPEMARVMMQSSPPEGIRVLTDRERAEDWAAIQGRILPVRRSRRRRMPRVLAYAAAALLVGGAAIIYLESRSKVQPVSRSHPPEVAAARRIERRELRPDEVERGRESLPSTTLPSADQYDLEPLTALKVHYNNYRIDILDLDANHMIWTRSGLLESPDGSFRITVSNEVLKRRGRYQLVLYGTSAGKVDRLATYTVRVLS